MPAGPDVASAPAPEPDDTAPAAAQDDPPPAADAPPPPPPRPAAPPPAPDAGLLDELRSLDLDPAGVTAGTFAELPPPDPAEDLTPDPPPPPPAQPEPAPPLRPPPIPAPPRRAPGPPSAPASRPADPLLAGAPPAAPPRPRPTVPPQEAPEALDEHDYPFDFEDDLEESHSRWRTAFGWIFTVAVAIALSLVIRAFVAHAFHVESGSMEPTLAPGDRILVNKLAGYPSRGNLVVFSRSDGDLVKRVVGLAGETLYFFDDGVVGVDDQYLREPYLAAGTGTFVRAAIPNCEPSASVEGAVACTVPADHFFVLGDNREVSFDSRNYGPVHRDDLIGNAALQFWPLGDMRGL